MQKAIDNKDGSAGSGGYLKFSQSTGSLLHLIILAHVAGVGWSKLNINVRAACRVKDALGAAVKLERAGGSATQRDSDFGQRGSRVLVGNAG